MLQSTMNTTHRLQSELSQSPSATAGAFIPKVTVSPRATTSTPRSSVKANRQVPAAATTGGLSQTKQTAANRKDQILNYDLPPNPQQVRYRNATVRDIFTPEEIQLHQAYQGRIIGLVPQTLTAKFPEPMLFKILEEVQAKLPLHYPDDVCVKALTTELEKRLQPWYQRMPWPTPSQAVGGGLMAFSLFYNAGNHFNWWNQS